MKAVAGTEILLCACALFCSFGTLALADDGPGKSARDSEEKSIYTITEASSAITIDGVLDEPAWQDALAIELKYETYPGDNTPPKVKTLCYLTYDKSYLYAAFKALDHDPGAIRAHITDRDSAFSDDFVGLMIDTFNDERNAFEFFVNTLGVQMDGLRDDLSYKENFSWDAIWNSAGKITSEGYIVEMAIPFNQLRFQRTKGEQTWGIVPFRVYPRDQRMEINALPFDRNKIGFLTQVPKVTGFQGITPGRNAEITPTITSIKADKREDFPAGAMTEVERKADLGVTARWGITPNITFSGTLNPDFSQVEADVAQLDVNNRFALYYPETRQFFLEGSDFFRMPYNVVHTRTIADPSIGLKLTGKEGKNAFGVFAATDELTNLLFPGSQGSRSTSLDIKSTSAVFRYRRDIGTNSTIGLIGTDREGSDYHNRLAGIDGKIQFAKSDWLEFQYLHSDTAYPDEVASEFDQPFGDFDDGALSVKLSHDTRSFDYNLIYQNKGDNFRADNGFMTEVGTKSYTADVNYTFWPENHWLSRHNYGVSYSRTEDQHSTVVTSNYQYNINIYGPMQWHFGQRSGHMTQTYNGQEFPINWFNLSTSARPTGDLYMAFNLNYNDQIDYVNTRLGKRLAIFPYFRYAFNRSLLVTLQPDFERLDVEGGRLYTVYLTQLRLIYQFNVRMFFRAIFQYQDISRDAELYLNEVDPKSQSLFMQLLFSYKLNPQTVLYLGYNETRAGDQDIELTQSNRAFFVKIGYAWVL